MKSDYTQITQCNPIQYKLYLYSRKYKTAKKSSVGDVTFFKLNTQKYIIKCAQYTLGCTCSMCEQS